MTINASDSELLDVDNGVPPGSILGPLLYLLFTCDLRQEIHDDECKNKEKMEKNFDTMCDKCIGIVTFADDTTATVTDPDPDSLSEKVTAMYGKIAKYLTENRLVVNNGKTHLLVMCSNQKRK